MGARVEATRERLPESDRKARPRLTNLTDVARQAPSGVAFSLLRASCPPPCGPASPLAPLLRHSGYSDLGHARESDSRRAAARKPLTLKLAPPIGPASLFAPRNSTKAPGLRSEAGASRKVRSCRSLPGSERLLPSLPIPRLHQIHLAHQLARSLIGNPEMPREAENLGALGIQRGEAQRIFGLICLA
jgi:hypothetical protein